MRLRSLRLKNIRSYTDEQIEFPDGVTLLAGDIGSGKSTLLLALEFALFGIQRGELSGGQLLRHGSRNGSVTLSLEVGGKEIEITRGLKRTDAGVTQEAGTLTVDGATMDATAQELKARILELLNYPRSLLARGKGNLFRYTVYTPQEEMKAILFEKPEERLDTLRKLFDMDKYKRAREHAALLLRELRREELTLKQRSDELALELKDEHALQERLATAQKRLALDETALEQAHRDLKSKKDSFEQLDRDRFQLEELKKNHAVLATRLAANEARLKELGEQRGPLQEQIAETEKHLSPGDVDERALAEDERKLNEFQQRFKDEERAIIKDESNAEQTIKRAEQVVTQIGALAECPTCRQVVGPDHKEHIRSDEAKRIAEAKALLLSAAERRKELKMRFEALDKKRAVLLQKQQLLGANRVKLNNLRVLKERLALHDRTAETIMLQVEQERSQEATLRAKVIATAFDPERYGRLRHDVENAQTVYTRASVALAEAKKDRLALEKELLRVTERKEEKRRKDAQLLVTRRRIVWLEKGFSNTAYAIEKALFHSVYGLFNDAFREWFAMLLEDETISVRLDAEFTPLLVQNGYETNVENLSGGERTSVALAYRLALTKSVNEFLGSINTKDLLILDEPTDGFSSEQLDRVRDVLQQLRLQQILIVSHEVQMEGYVDHVLRVQKQGHESKVV